MKKIFLEGLPGVGKTTIINEIKKRKIKDIHVVDEILSGKKGTSQKFYMQNDINKVKKYNGGIVVIDRGAISTLSYNECLNQNEEISEVVNWFSNVFKDFYNNEDVETIYLKRKKPQYLLRYENVLDPYGSIDNQKKLEKRTLENIKKYCKNYKIIYIDNYSLEEIIDEIIN